MFRIVYLPLARKELIDVVLYITETLESPQAANRLLDAIEEAVSKLSRFPYSCKVFTAKRPLHDEYRMLTVRNYAIFYVVLPEENIVEIRRIVHARRNLEQLIMDDF